MEAWRDDLPVVINLEVFGETVTMAKVAERLDELDDVSRVRLVDATRASHSVVVAAVRPRAVVLVPEYPGAASIPRLLLLAAQVLTSPAGPGRTARAPLSVHGRSRRTPCGHVGHERRKGGRHGPVRAHHPPAGRGAASVRWTGMADIVVITGLSGAGRTNAAADLEDQGWYVVDNLPTSLVRTIVELASVPGSAIERLALVVGTSPQQADILDAIESLRTGGHRVRIVYLETSTPELVKRYGSTRRRHPLGDDTSLLEAIDRERELLEPVKAEADVVIDTTDLNIHQLKTRLTELFAEDAATAGMQTAIVSFGYKHGLPLDVDIVLDCRFLPNPFWDERLRPLTGLDPAVRDYVLAPAGDRAVPRAARGPPAPPGPGLRGGGQELPDHRLRVHRRPAPVRRGGRGGGRPAACAGASSCGSSTGTCRQR